MRVEHFLNFPYQINLKINILETNGPMELKFCLLSVLKIYNAYY